MSADREEHRLELTENGLCHLPGLQRDTATVELHRADLDACVCKVLIVALAVGEIRDTVVLDLAVGRSHIHGP